MKIDFSDVKEPEAVPAGQYEATFTGHREKTSQAKGTKYIALEFTISDGDYAGRKVFRNISLGENSLWFLKNTMISLGADPELFAGAFDTDEELANLYGASVLIETSLRDSNQEGRGPTAQVDRIRDLTFA